ncbi:MAG: aminotransferase class IV [Verrucomicrobiota bacterium]
MVIPITDEGFRYGRGVFETLKVVRGNALFQSWHEENLRKAAEALSIDVSPLFFIDEAPKGTGIWRWYLTESGIESTFSTRSETIPESATLNLATMRVNSHSWEARHKTLNYLSRVQAREESSSFEVVMLNEHGEIASASMANVFWVSQGMIHTPGADAGCRRGVIRRWIIEQSGEKVKSGRFPVKSLDEADEIFLTNSRIGILPVTDWDGKVLEVGPIASKLWKSYSAFL